MVEFALGTNRAIMRQNDMLCDRQSQTSPTRFARASLVHAIETLEQSWQVLIRNARAEIAHVKLNSTIRPPRSQHQPATRRSIFEGIVNEVGENLMNGLAIGVDQIRR